MNDPGQILAHVRAQRDEMIGLLADLVRIETPSDVPAAQGPALDLLRAHLEESGFRCRHLPGRRSGGMLLALPHRSRKGQPRQLLLGHVDTVWPMGTLETMPLRIAGNRIEGPGVYDMKGGLVQMLFALRALVELGLPPEAEPVVFVNSDEETGSRESTRHIVRFARCCHRAFVMEPSLGPTGKLKTARKGVGRFTVHVQGEPAHAGLDPGGGVSAILELSHQIQHLFEWNDPDGGISLNVGKVEGGTSVNVVAPRSSAEVDLRVPTIEAARRMERKIFHLAPRHPGARITVEGGIRRPPMEPTPRNRGLWEQARQVAAFLSLEIEEGTAGGASDGNTASLYTATLDGLGAVGNGAHARHEHILIDAMLERTALLACLLLAPVRASLTAAPANRRVHA